VNHVTTDRPRFGVAERTCISVDSQTSLCRSCGVNIVSKCASIIEVVSLFAAVCN